MKSIASRRPPLRPRWPVGPGTRWSARGAALVVLSTLLVTGCGLLDVTAEERGAQEAAMTSGGTVEIETWNGGIEVRGCPGTKVQIAFVKLGAGGSKEDAQADIKNVEVVVEEGPGGVKIVGRRKDGKTSGSSGASFVLCVPRTTPVVAKTRNGAITVADVGATVAAETSNGAVTVKDATGPLALTSMNGRIEATGRDAVLMLSTENGAVSFEGTLAAGDHSMKTKNGSIDVALPVTSVFGLTATTGNGTVTCDLPLEGPGERSAKQVEGVTGPNAASILTLATSNGSVHVRESR